MLVDSDHFSIRLHISLLSPAGRTKTIRQKRNGLDFQAKYGSCVSEDDTLEAGNEISILYKEFSAANPQESRHECLQLAVAQAVGSLSKKNTGKKGWYEGNEAELLEWIEKRNAATLRHATSKSLEDLAALRLVRATLKKVKRKSKNEWWMNLLRKCNATVNPSATDNKYPGSIWSTRKTIMTKGARWLPRSFQNVRDRNGEKASTPEGNAENLSACFADIFDPKVNPDGWKEIEAMTMTQRQELVGWGAPREHETRSAILHLKETAAGPSGVPACAGSAWRKTKKCSRSSTAQWLAVGNGR